MTFDLIPFLIYNVVFIIATVFSEFLHKIVKMEALFTRKVAHALTGSISATFPFFIESHWTVAAIASIFLALLVVSRSRGFLKSINKIAAVTYGSVLYPIAIYFSFLAYSFVQSEALYVAVILVLALADPLAALSGTLAKRKDENIRTFGRDKKTYIGSSVFFMVAFSLIFLISSQLSDFTYMQIFVMATGGASISTFAEAWSINGLDNILIPSSLGAFLFLFLYFSHLL